MKHREKNWMHCYSFQIRSDYPGVCLGPGPTVSLGAFLDAVHLFEIEFEQIRFEQVF